MSSISIQYYPTPHGELLLGSYADKLCISDWRYRRMRQSIDARLQSKLGAKYKEESSEVIQNTIIQLAEYFEQKRTFFDIPLLLIGTDFQISVWNALLQIPYGEKVTYAQLSEQMKQPKAIRAIASANGANALSIIVPCHRVIGTGGKLVGYAGGLITKKNLLLLESKDQQLELFANNQ